MSSTPATDIETVAASPDGRFLYAWDRQVIRAAPIGADGLPGELSPGSVSVDVSTPSRMLFQPQPAPVAAFTAERAAPKKPARFDAGTSERAARFDWDFGDGTVLADGGPTPTHTYAKGGYYDVTLTVTDESGCSARQIYTGQSTTCAGGPGATATSKLDTLSAISKLKVKPKKLATGGGKSKRTKARSPTSSARRPR